MKQTDASYRSDEAAHAKVAARDEADRRAYEADAMRKELADAAHERDVQARRINRDIRNFPWAWIVGGIIVGLAMLLGR